MSGVCCESANGVIYTVSVLYVFSPRRGRYTNTFYRTGYCHQLLDWSAEERATVAGPLFIHNYKTLNPLTRLSRSY